MSHVQGRHTGGRKGPAKEPSGSVSMMSGPALHTDIAHLSPLLGTWRGKGAGEYPTIDSFTYVEEVTFGHVGKPFLAYSQKTRHAETELPLHAEAGYLRPAGPDRLELVLAQPSGIVEIDEGTVEANDGALEISLDSATVAVSSTAKSVTSVRRIIRVDGDTLTYRVEMGAVGQPHQHHLAATLTRVDQT